MFRNQNLDYYYAPFPSYKGMQEQYPEGSKISSIIQNY